MVGLRLLRHFTRVWAQLRATFETYALDCNSLPIPELLYDDVKLYQLLTSEDPMAPVGTTLSSCCTAGRSAGLP